MKSKAFIYLFIFCAFTFLGQLSFSAQTNDALSCSRVALTEYLVINECLQIDECRNILETFYKNSSIDVNRVINSSEKLKSFLFSSINKEPNKRDVDLEAEALTLYLFHANILTFAHDMGAIKDAKKIEQLDADIAIFMKAIKQTAQTYLKYADYLFLKLAHGNKIAVHALPIIYRKVLSMEGENIEAYVKLAMWYINPADESTSNFRGFIEYAEKFIEELESVDRFNACLWYSIYYMKCYNEKKGFEYLNKANLIFAQHVYIAHLWNNYKNGVIGM